MSESNRFSVRIAPIKRKWSSPTCNHINSSTVSTRSISNSNNGLVKNGPLAKTVFKFRAPHVWMCQCSGLFFSSDRQYCFDKKPFQCKREICLKKEKKPATRSTVDHRRWVSCSESTSLPVLTSLEKMRLVLLENGNLIQFQSPSFSLKPFLQRQREDWSTRH